MDQYINHRAILDELETKFPTKEWNEESVLKWCQQVETIYVADPDSMWLYRKIPLAIKKGKALLPSNLYRLLDVFDGEDPDLEARVRFNRQGKVLKQLIDYKKDVIWINYIGTPIDEQCLPLIYEDHFPACETLCKINGFEGDALYSEVNQNIYGDWKQRFDGMIQGVKGGYRNWTAQDFADMTIIMGNEITHIGFQPLAHKYTNNGII